MYPDKGIIIFIENTQSTPQVEQIESSALRLGADAPSTKDKGYVERILSPFNNSAHTNVIKGHHILRIQGKGNACQRYNAPASRFPINYPKILKSMHF